VEVTASGQNLSHENSAGVAAREFVWLIGGGKDSVDDMSTELANREGGNIQVDQVGLGDIIYSTG
jgi:hypothetical protein